MKDDRAEAPQAHSKRRSRRQLSNEAAPVATLRSKLGPLARVFC